MMMVVMLLFFMARKSGTFFNILNRVHYIRMGFLQNTPVDIVVIAAAFIGESVLVCECMCV